MRLPRFRMRTLLVFFAVVALWLSTVAGYRSAGDVRSFVLLSIVVGSAGAAVSYDGRRRAFWLGFFITVLTVGIHGKPLIGVHWITYLLNSYGLYQNLPDMTINYRFMFLDASLQALLMLLLATVMGVLGMLVYEHCREKD
jgi:hypothetical protein